jgi:hypothetical protein
MWIFSMAVAAADLIWEALSGGFYTLKYREKANIGQIREHSCSSVAVDVSCGIIESPEPGYVTGLERYLSYLGKITAVGSAIEYIE